MNSPPTTSRETAEVGSAVHPGPDPPRARRPAGAGGPRVPGPQPVTDRLHIGRWRPTTRVRFLVLAIVVILVAFAGLALGSVRLPLPEVIAALTGNPADETTNIILQDVRGPRTITALLVGAALGVSGLQMQTLFRNPLADPYVLGVSSGASLGVALVVLAVGTSAYGTSFSTGLGLGGDVGVVVAAALGSAMVMTLVLAVGRRVQSSTTLLLVGVMVGYFVSAGVTVLLAGAQPELVAQYTRWGFGSYRGVTWRNLTVLVPLLITGLLLAVPLAKPLNALLLGERYAQTLGLNIRVLRTMLIACTSVLAGSATAFCGPIAFLGIAIPHLTRGLFATSDHRVLVPACAMTGGAIALMAEILAQLPGEEILPLNAINAVFGAPVVIAILIRRRRVVAA